MHRNRRDNVRNRTLFRSSATLAVPGAVVATVGLLAGCGAGSQPAPAAAVRSSVLRRRSRGESVASIRPDLIIPAGKRKGGTSSLASIYRAITEHEKRQSYPEAVDQAHADFASLQTSA